MDRSEKSDGAGQQPGEAKRSRGVLGQPAEASKLGEVISEYIQRVGPRQSYFSVITEAWDELVPVELRGHCTLADYSEGRLKVTVDSPAYLYELRLRRGELLRELQRLVRGARGTQVDGEKDAVQPIRELKFVIG